MALKKIFASINSRIVDFSLVFGFFKVVLMSFNGWNFVFFWSAGTPWYFFSVFLAGVTKICWRLHYFYEGKEVIPCLYKFCVPHDCISCNFSCMFIRSSQLCYGSGIREKLDPKTLVARRSTWQRKAFSLSVIVYEAYNILQGWVWVLCGVPFWLLWTRGARPLLLKCDFRFKSLFLDMQWRNKTVLRQTWWSLTK